MKEDKEKDKEESPEHESKESPEKETSEHEGGEDGVKVPEEFQKKAHALLKECKDEACLSYLRNCISEKEDEYREQKHAEMKKKHGTPSEYSTSDMPSY